MRSQKEAMKLAQFYTMPYVEQALASYRTAVPPTWGVGHKLDLYNYAKAAFETGASETEKEASFDRIYESLCSGWQVFRNAAGPCWSAAQTFQVLTTACAPCSRQSHFTAVTLIGSDYHSKIQECLSSMGSIKPTTHYPEVYPWMAVSKFLHFFNPRLFPIYDLEFVWKKVANGVFKQDYWEFCERHGFNPIDDTQQFNLQYTLWANEIMCGSDSACMAAFAHWFTLQTDGHADPQGIRQEVHQYYAAAFEMIAIGAAHCNSS
jgi:hypothetical protein